MLNIYDYPVMLTAEEVQTCLEVSDIPRALIEDAHTIIYDHLIYPTYNADLKNRVIERYRAELEGPIKRALLAQVKYLKANGGNIGEWNGFIGGAQGVDSKVQNDVAGKIIAPQAREILRGASVDILYTGE